MSRVEPRWEENGKIGWEWGGELELREGMRRTTRNEGHLRGNGTLEHWKLSVMCEGDPNEVSKYWGRQKLTWPTLLN